MDNDQIYQELLNWIEEQVKNARECSCIPVYIKVAKKIKEMKDGND